MRSAFLLLVVAVPYSAAHAQDPPRKPLKYDAAVEAIIVPSDDPRYADFNPAVHEPRVVIRNDGIYPLAGISIRYGTEGFQMRMFAWTGHLATGATAEVTLPHLIDMRPGLNTFTVSLGDPNGKKDKDKTDNTRSTTFTAAPAWGSPLTVRLRTPLGNGGTLRLESTRGPILLDWKWNARMDTVLREAVFPPNGSYILTVTDSGRAGPAVVRMLNAAGEPVRSLQSRARSGNQYQFRVDTNAPTPAEFINAADVIPRPGRGMALVEVQCAQGGEVVIRDWEDEPVDGWTVAAGTEVAKSVDLSAHKSGTYRVFLRQGEDESEIGRIVLP